MRIAFVTPEYITEPNFDGGLANYLYRTAHALKMLRHEPVIIVAAHRDEQIEHEGIPIFRTDVRNRLFDGAGKILIGGLTPALDWIWQSWLLNRKLVSIHRHQKIDIAQYTSYRATALFRTVRFPSVVRLSSVQALLDNAYEKPKSLGRTLLHHLELKAVQKADCVYAPSFLIASIIERKTQRSVNVLESPFMPFKGAADVRPFEDLMAGKRYLLFFGSIGLLKGVKTIADILPNLLNKYEDLYFVFAGKDLLYQGKPMMQYVLDRAGALRGRVLYLGRLPQNQLYPVIEGAEAVVLPSRVDNLPNTCLEAMAQGKIVIGTRGASFEQLIEDGVNGFLCKIDNGPSLLDGIERALAVIDKTQMGNCAKDTIKRLAPERVINKLLEVYAKAACP